MPKASRRKQTLEFSQKLVLNQWLISLFGVDPLADGYKRGEKPFHKLADLNAFVVAFNEKYDGFEPIAPYDEEALNKVCFDGCRADCHVCRGVFE